MLNRSGITKETLAAPVQILANVQHQHSVGCIVPQSMGVTVGAKKIVKAGTPLNINLQSLSTAAVAPAAAGQDTAAIPMNAVALHDVDVTAGAANATALIFGFVNLNRVDSTTASAINTALGYGTPSPLLVFTKQ